MLTHADLVAVIRPALAKCHPYFGPDPADTAADAVLKLLGPEPVAVHTWQAEEAVGVLPTEPEAVPDVAGRDVARRFTAEHPLGTYEDACREEHAELYPEHVRRAPFTGTPYPRHTTDL